MTLSIASRCFGPGFRKNPASLLVALAASGLEIVVVYLGTI
jgi:hypothetical protein